MLVNQNSITSTRDDYGQLVYGKHVCVVGGSSHVEIPEGVDTVIRCNVNYKAVVAPADVLYLSSAPDIGQLENNLDHYKLKYVWLNMNAGNTFMYADMCRKRRLPHAYYTRYTGVSYKAKQTWTAKLQQTYDFLPLTGVIAMYHTMRFTPARMHLTGMDFYYDYVTNTAPLYRHSFDLTKNKKAVKDLVTYYSDRITMDSRLTPIINGGL